MAKVTNAYDLPARWVDWRFFLFQYMCSRIRENIFKCLEVHFCILSPFKHDIAPLLLYIVHLLLIESMKMLMPYCRLGSLHF